MMNGGDLYELATILGHANIKMTERYVKLGKTHSCEWSDHWRIHASGCSGAISRFRDKDPIKLIPGLAVFRSLTPYSIRTMDWRTRWLTLQFIRP
jgi:hypothetical protein